MIFFFFALSRLGERPQTSESYNSRYAAPWSERSMSPEHTQIPGYNHSREDHQYEFNV